MNSQRDLHGLRVLVTRPADQAEPLCRLIEEAGGKALRLPALEIRDPDPGELARLDAVVRSLESYDLAVFISVNAVTRAMEFIRSRRSWPASVRIATVGAASAEALARYGLAVDLVPAHHFNSEALLELAELRDMRGRRVVIFRGYGGRDLLRDDLFQRGAVVEYVEVYRRACPVVDPLAIAHYWQPGAVDLITITSNESLQNLHTMAGAQGQPLLRALRLVVISERQAALARELGFTRAPLVAANASDEAILAVLRDYVSGAAKR